MPKTYDRQLRKWIKANPWILVNVQCSQAMCGRFQTEQDAIDYIRKSGYEHLGTEGRQVLFSAMPQL